MNPNKIIQSFILQIALMLPSACGGAVGDPSTNTTAEQSDAAAGDAALPTPTCTGPFYDEALAPPVAFYRCAERAGSNCTPDPAGGYLCTGVP